MSQKKRGARERVYDQQIAPLLLQAAQLCQQHDMPLVAQVEYQPGDFGLTYYLKPEHGLSMHLLYWAAKAKNNFDAFMRPVLNHAEERGHTSSYLAILFRALKGTDMVRPPAAGGDA